MNDTQGAKARLRGGGDNSRFIWAIRVRAKVCKVHESRKAVTSFVNGDGKLILSVENRLEQRGRIASAGVTNSCAASNTC